MPYRDGEEPNEQAMLDLEVREDGGLRLLVGRLTAKWGTNRRTDEEVTCVLDHHAVAYSLLMVQWAVGIVTATGYRGEWALGVHGTGMRGHKSSVFAQDWSGYGGSAYDAEDYRETTTATFREVTERPAAVAERLVGRLVRALSTEQHWSGALSPET